VGYARRGRSTRDPPSSSELSTISANVWPGMDTGLLGLELAVPYFRGIEIDSFRRGWIVGGPLSSHDFFLCWFSPNHDDEDAKKFGGWVERHHSAGQGCMCPVIVVVVRNHTLVPSFLVVALRVSAKTHQHCLHRATVSASWSIPGSKWVKVAC